MTRRIALGLVFALAATPAIAAAQAGDNPHGVIKDQCGSCHTSNGWKSIAIARTFEHAPRTFPLEGAHERVSCASCHKSLEFSRAPVTCASCHQDVHKGELGVTCGSCHTARSFIDRATMQRTHELTRFPLRGAHVGADCSACHTLAPAGRAQFVNTPTQCVACHTTDYRQTTAPNHIATKIATDCASCHAPSTWTGAKFDHSRTAFPLTGAHIAQTCAECHTEQVFTGRGAECVGCHQQDYDAAKAPVHTAGFPTACATCHTTQTFVGAKFEHNVNTKFALTGAHVTAVCSACHADRVFSGKTQTCVACHQTEYDATTNPRHGAAGFSTTCTECHNTTAYRGATYDHGKTRFPLTGAHATATCAGCHADQVYRGKALTCGSCHMSDFGATTQPPHAASGFPTTCESCHSSTTTWNGGVFSHATTRFPLTGAHLATTCADCHGDGVFRGKPVTCVSCHQTEFNQTTNPPHAQAGFSTACDGCHTTASFTGARFDHSATSFPLTGAHIAQTCLACHADRVYDGKPQTCVSCHITDYNATTSPSHRATGFATTCESCHSTTDWRAAFDHSKTLFPLTGAHMAATCSACHADNVYKGKPTSCVSCHLTTYNGTTSPNHASVGYSTNCAACHSTSQWPGATFNHNTTAFPLTGAHGAVLCRDCHVNGIYKGTPTACAGCHQSDFNGTTNPPHVAGGFPTTCTSCHTTAPGWKPATFNHNATAFPLTGSHLAALCTDCHGTGVYKGTPTACIGCHQTDYNNSSNPPHVAAAFPTTCSSCHTTNPGWKPSSFNHGQTSFPLTGAHLTATCLDCHSDGVYNGKPTTCVSCHQTDYNNTTNPRHSTAGFPTDCASCHTTSRWLGATFNHDGQFFPIYSGEHKGKWNTCADCHVTAANYKAFECILCHEHSNKTDVDRDHRQVNGYQYKSTSCYACHPRGD